MNTFGNIPNILFSITVHIVKGTKKALEGPTFPLYSDTLSKVREGEIAKTTRSRKWKCEQNNSTASISRQRATPRVELTCCVVPPSWHVSAAHMWQTSPRSMTPDAGKTAWTYSEQENSIRTLCKTKSSQGERLLSVTHFRMYNLV